MIIPSAMVVGDTKTMNGTGGGGGAEEEEGLEFETTRIEDLFNDLKDGKRLMDLLEIIAGKKIGKPNKGVLR